MKYSGSYFLSPLIVLQSIPASFSLANKLASNLFWQLCERKFQELVNVCDDTDQAQSLRKNFAGFANQAYDTFCAKDTARQLDAWAKNRPNLGKYLKDQNKHKEEAPA